MIPKQYTSEKVYPMVAAWKLAGQRIVFTNGVFDILHLGHVRYLEAAKQTGDRLIIGINSDASVRRLNKGPERPINPEYARAEIVAALKWVDAVIVFDEDTPASLIHVLQPDVLVKGGDYDPEETHTDSRRYIVGSQEVRKKGGKVLSIPIVEGFSTTAIVGRLQQKK